MGKKLYLVSGRLTTHPGLALRAGRRGWFGRPHQGGERGWQNFIETRSLRHANAQYRRLKIADRQLDVRENRKARVLKWGKTK